MPSSKINKTVYLFSSQNHSSFIYNEIQRLSEYFEHVYIIVMDGDIYPFKLQSNVKIVNLNYNNYNSFKVLKPNILFFFKILFLDIIQSPSSYLKFKILKINISILLRNFFIADKVYNASFFKRDYILYTFWFDEWATTLSILKSRKRIDDYFSLAHGFDLYEERTPITKRIAFRWFQLKYVCNVYSVSKVGANYLKNKYPKYAEKIKTNYLQTTFYGTNKLSKTENVLVTCANFALVKRLILIPDILLHFNIPVKWIHIGNLEPKDKDVKQFLLKVNDVCIKNPLVNIKLCGMLTNDDVHKFYLDNSINALLSVSESEGIPVSMMEAISFGIPIICTDVGGCSEIVTPSTGILIEKNFKSEEVAKIIIDFLASNKNTEEYRDGVYDFWKENFSTNEAVFLSKFN